MNIRVSGLTKWGQQVRASRPAEVGPSRRTWMGEARAGQGVKGKAGPVDALERTGWGVGPSSQSTHPHPPF